MSIKELTILHSNDLHGDFLSEDQNGKHVGGISLLSGYINKVRTETPNTIYAIAGDMFRGSVIDSEFQGMSTIEIMNLLSPDVVALGNHELDYGIANLIFLERCAQFPIVNANLYITTTGTRLFRPYKIIKIGGMRVLFIGVLTESILDGAKNDRLLGTFVNVQEAATEVGKICNAHKNIQIDLTVLLTHIGYEEDKRLASLLDPEWGVDAIVGGHSHTLVDRPEKVNNILITQAGSGSDMIGRFDLKVDTDTKSIVSYEWSSVPIDDKHCVRDEALDKLINGYKTETDKKYRRFLTHLPRALTHPERKRETEVGNLFSDMMAKSLGVDIAFVGSGSLRELSFGPIVDYGALCEMYPYNDSVYHFKITGTMLRKIFMHLFRPEVWDGAHTEFYQVSRGVHVKYSKSRCEILELTWQGKEVTDEQVFNVSVQSYHFGNLERFFGITPEEVEKLQKPKIVCTNAIDVFDDYLMENPHPYAVVEGRMEIVD